MSGAQVREAVASDAQTLADLILQFNREGSERLPSLTADEVRRLGFEGQPRFRALLAEHDGTAVGYALFYPSYDTEHAAKGFYMQDLYVVPHARRRGVGRALMAALARMCISEDSCYLFWNAHEMNRGGRAFYRRIGAREEPVVTLSLQPDALAHLAQESDP